MLLVPWQPESKATFETDMNYMQWGELLNYYTDFIGNLKLLIFLLNIKIILVLSTPLLIITLCGSRQLYP